MKLTPRQILTTDFSLIYTGGEYILVNGVLNYPQDVPCEMDRLSGYKMNEQTKNALRTMIKRETRNGYVEIAVVLTTDGEWVW